MYFTEKSQTIEYKRDLITAQMYLTFIEMDLIGCGICRDVLQLISWNRVASEPPALHLLPTKPKASVARLSDTLVKPVGPQRSQAGRL